MLKRLAKNFKQMASSEQLVYVFKRIILGAIAEYPAQLVIFESTATEVSGPQSATKVLVYAKC